MISKKWSTGVLECWSNGKNISRDIRVVAMIGTHLAEIGDAQFNLLDK
jgi:hypothetical protein